jgi:putative transposase
LEKIKEIHPFELQAYVVLADHFHWLMKVDKSSGKFSKIMHSIKSNFTRYFKHTHDIQKPLNIWQRGFWDHVIRDEQDFGTHLDYIYWNPVKHGCVNKPEDWPNSSYKDWVKEGVYEQG